MGGRVTLQSGPRVRPHSVILIEASPPGEIQGFNPEIRLVEGTFDPEAVYGPFPAGVRAWPESSWARAERKRGVSVPGCPCPSLVIYGDEFSVERGTAIARHYGSEERSFPGLDHWGLVFDAQVRHTIAAFL